MAAVRRDLRTPQALATEVARVLDSIARDTARVLLDAKEPLPIDADWLTRAHYTQIKAARDEQHRREQAEAWDSLYAAQEARRKAGQA